MEIPEAVRQFLSAPRFAVVATINPDGSPQLTVLWYDLDHGPDGDVLLLNTKAGRLKEENLQRDPRVSACVEDGYSYVTIRGTAQLVYDQAVAQADIRRLAVRYQGSQQGNQMADQQFAKEQRITIRVPLTYLSAYGLGT
jgi:PPOX class probable F420-dependent enzyme